MKKRKNHKFRKLLYPKPLSFAASDVNVPKKEDEKKEIQPAAVPDIS